MEKRGLSHSELFSLAIIAFYSKLDYHLKQTNKSIGVIAAHLKQWTMKNHRHFWFVLFLPAYLFAYWALEQYTAPHYWISYIPLDDSIPFVDFFVIFYFMWYAYVILSGLFLMFADRPVFLSFMRHLMAGLILSVVICFIFPNAQELRPAEFERTTPFTSIVQAIYSVDTNTNVLPSKHVVGTLATAVAACKS